MPEILTCRRFLHAEIGAMRNLAAILTLGRLAHKSVLSALGLRERDYAFRHGAQYAHESLALFASYHCSRYNTNTGVLTAAMFDRIIKRTKKAAGL
jgi:uracil-DNA glycosylase